MISMPWSTTSSTSHTLAQFGLTTRSPFPRQYTWTVDPGLAINVGDPLIATALATNGKLYGSVTSYSGTTLVTLITGASAYDSTAYASWSIIEADAVPAQSGPPLPRPVPGSNALGLFKVGVSPLGTIPPFDFWTTVQAQYANSPIMTALIANMAAYIDPTQWFDDFWSVFMNLPTAAGAGLDVLGRIVGVGRVLNLGTASYFGFEEGLPGPLPFNAGTFYTGGGLTTNFALADGPYRVLILAKALANISDASMASINSILMTLFAGRGNAYVTNGQNMTMTLTFTFPLTAVELAIVAQSGAIPIPAGVSFTVIQI